MSDLPPGIMIMADGRIQGPSGTWLKQSIGAQGYPVIGLRDGRRVKVYTVHSLVCRAFNGPRPSPQHQVAHTNGIRTDCRASNLRWATRRENERDKITHGTWGKKLTLQQVRDIRAAYAAGGISYSEIGARFAISPSHACAIVNRRTWREVA